MSASVRPATAGVRAVFVWLDGRFHRSREQSGEHHLTVCGRYARGSPAERREGVRPSPLCSNCESRLDLQPLGDDEPDPQAVRRGRGLRFSAKRLPSMEGNQ